MSKKSEAFEGVDQEDVCIWMHMDEWYEVLDMMKIVENLAADSDQKKLVASRREEIKKQVFAYIQASWELEHS